MRWQVTNKPFLEDYKFIISLSSYRVERLFIYPSAANCGLSSSSCGGIMARSCCTGPWVTSAAANPSYLHAIEEKMNKVYFTHCDKKHLMFIKRC